MDRNTVCGSLMSDQVIQLILDFVIFEGVVPLKTGV